MALSKQFQPGAWRLLLCPLGLSFAMAAAAQEAAPANTAAAQDPVPPIATAAPTAIEHQWTLAAPRAERVEFRGLASFDQAGVDNKAVLVVGGGHPALAAVTAASFLINAAVINYSRESQKSSVQIAADKVLLPYEAVLVHYRSSDLFAQALAETRRIAPKTKGETPRQVAAIPVFSMTQDQQAIVLDSHVEVRASDSAPPLFASSIRVVSPALDSADPAAHWNADLGQPLRGASESLLAEALRLALLFSDGGIAPSQTMGPKSLRFMQGGTERVERAELLLQDCSRTVLRTLRGTLMSVPTHRPDEKCPTSAASTPGTSPSN